MASYDAWNKGIAAYFVAGAAKGSPIFLSVDLDAIEEIGATFLDEPVAGDPLHDFIEAVRHRCVLPFRDSIGIENLTSKAGDIPGGVAMLGLMVFAAYKMQEEEGIDESNYFLRLREVLQLPRYQRRPEGMPAGAEEPLWEAWNKYVSDAGFQVTAERGAGPQTYVRYVFSQAILRESDKQYLRQRFHDSLLPLQFDSDQLGFWLSRQNINRRHLFEGLHHPDPGRVWEFYRAAHRMYEAGDWINGLATRQTNDRTRLRTIECGLYRSEDLLGEPQYWLFPKQPARTRSRELKVTPPGGTADHLLRSLRAGFFTPLWTCSPFVNDAIEYSVVGDPGIQKMLFPKRDFWILVRDPENPCGTWATWRPYLELGERLLMLSREGPFDKEMERFKAAKLLDWINRVECDGWVEYHGCMVLSYDWGGFITTPECRALADALAPRSMASVALLGGLRDPNQNAWLERFPPSMKVYGFERQFAVRVTSAHGIEVYQEEIQRQQDIALPRDLEPDTYQIEVKWSGKHAAVRMFRIVPWADIQEHSESEEVINSNPASTAGLSLRGALILQNSDDTLGGQYA